ncbi:hypothetical protein TrVE_jg10295 [Triparma verrucosa]|uniref:EF-hand domain-containing protein n=1 Tax=Triparma verrucosa TaxID=1606542 RepID=A0A9W7C6X1_9STRA|nr:hypothetical protein TrVE_jg10295 [Triparma verrucosa]
MFITNVVLACLLCVVLLSSVNSFSPFLIPNPNKCGNGEICYEIRRPTGRGPSGGRHVQAQVRTQIRLKSQVDDVDSSLSAALSETQTFFDASLLELFSKIDVDSSGSIDESELSSLLTSLSITASPSDVSALFSSLDVDASGTICFEEFSQWYSSTLSNQDSHADSVRTNILSRHTAAQFETMTVPNSVVTSALECAIKAPNHRLTEPWKFYLLGPKSIQSASDLVPSKSSKWSKIPGWMVFTSKKSDDPVVHKENLLAVACSVQNFMLSLNSNGIGSKWMTSEFIFEEEFGGIVGVEGGEEEVVGCVWFGFEVGGNKGKGGGKRRKGVEEVLTITE